ncbi:MAG: hypothetical protein J1F68_00610 [Clostridiales bacterium]|nr:hypothetical protein [Clostridiales bacterium]
MSKRIRAISLCCVTVLCCLALIVGGTYALFSDSVNVVNHLQSGELKVQLWRDELSSTLLSDQGLLTSVQDNVAKEFTKATNDNIFGLSDEVKVVPGCEFGAKFSLKNNGDVAICFYLEFVLQGEANKLAEQLQLTLKTDTNTQTVMLGNLGEKYLWGNASSPLGNVLLDGVGTFTVQLKFVDDDEVNNEAQGQQLTVDMIVHAVQLTWQN